MLLNFWIIKTSHAHHYLEYNATISCSSTGIAISSRDGIDRTIPFMLVASSSSQLGSVRRFAPSRAALIAVSSRLLGPALECFDQQVEEGILGRPLSFGCITE